MLWSKKKILESVEMPYKVVVLPRNYLALCQTLTEHKDYGIIFFGKSLDFAILKRGENMEDKEKQFIVREMPNNPSKIETLLNELHKQGYMVSCMNDYSIVFVKITQNG